MPATSEVWCYKVLSTLVLQTLRLVRHATSEVRCYKVCLRTHLNLETSHARSFRGLALSLERAYTNVSQRVHPSNLKLLSSPTYVLASDWNSMLIGSTHSDAWNGKWSAFFLHRSPATNDLRTFLSISLAYSFQIESRWVTLDVFLMAP
jgi:hypothetical protein